MKRLVCALAFVCLIFSACNAGYRETDKAGDVKAYVSVYAEHEDRFILESTEIAAKSDDTVLELLRKLMKENKIQMETGGDGDAAYVKGIDNIYELDEGPQSGWLFYVNGDMPSEGAGRLKVSDGDKIEWVYVTDWSETE